MPDEKKPETEAAPPEVQPLAPITITPANVVPSVNAVYQDGFASVAINAGQLVVINTVQGNRPVGTYYKLADAVTNYQVVGMAVNNAGVEQAIQIIVADPALVLGAGTVAAGDVLYLSPVAGGMTKTYADILATQYTQIVGLGIAAGTMKFSILRSDVAHA